MGKSILVYGKMDSNKDQEYINFQMAQRNMDNGKMTKESVGLKRKIQTRQKFNFFLTD